MGKLHLIVLLCTLNCSALLHGQTKAWQAELYPIEDTSDNSSNFILEEFDTNKIILGGALDDDALVSCADSNGVVLWSTSFGGTSLWSDQIRDIRVSQNGLIYVTGYLTNEVTGSDLFVKCFSSTGNEIYSFQRDGGIGASDEGLSIDVNTNGDVFVGGYITDSANIRRAYLLCLNSTGGIIWDIVTTGSAVGNCVYNCVMFTGGMLYTAGGVFNATSGNDAVAESRFPNGALNWSYEYDNNNNSNSYSLIQQNNGSLYLCGTSSGLIVTKLDTSGALMWHSNIGFDYGFKMAFMSTGDAVVTGTDNVSGNNEIRVCRISSGGTISWAYTFVPSPYNGIDAARAITIDNADQIYVTGEQRMSISNSDQLLLKLSPSGSLLWSRRRNGTFTGFTYEFASGIRVYASRIVTVGKLHNVGTNEDATISAYSGSGTSVFLNQYNNGKFSFSRNPQMIKTISNTIVVAASSNQNSILLEEYSVSGVTLRRDTIICPGTGMPWLKVLVTDSLGNLYIGSEITNSLGNYDIFITKIDAAWNVLWTATFASSLAANDRITAIAVDDSSNVYVAASGKVSTTVDAMLMKYSSTGTLLFTKTLGGSANNLDDALDVVIANDGSIYLLSYLINSGSGGDGLLAKFDTNGDTLWTRAINGPATTSNDNFDKLLLYSNNDIAVTSTLYFTTTDGNMVVQRYQPDGTLLWTSVLTNTSLVGYDNILDAAIDDDTIYVTGTSQQLNGSDILTSAIDPSGNTLWWSIHDGAGTNDDGGQGIAFDEFSQAVWITGVTYAQNYQDEVIVIGYTLSGVPIDTIIEIDNINNEEGVQALSIDSSGSLYITCVRSNKQVRTIKYCLGGASNSSNTQLLICSNDTIQLFAPSGFTYLWQPNVSISNTTAQSPYVFPSTSSTYTLAVTNAVGCSSISTDHISLAPDSILWLSFSSAQMCFGDSIQLQASGLQTYSWSPAFSISSTNSANPVVFGLDTIQYTLTGPNIFGCTSDTGVVTINVSPLPTVTLQLTISDTLCNSSSALNLTGGSPVGGTYSGNGVNGNFLNPSLADTGLNIITYSYIDPTSGCQNYALDSIYVLVCTEIASSDNKHFSAFPIPTNNFLNVQGQEAISNLQVFNVQGICVYQVENCNSKQIGIDVSQWSSGSYYLRVQTKDDRSVLRITIVH